MVDFAVAFCFAGFKECLDEVVVDVDAGFAPVAVGANEVDAVGFLRCSLDCDVA